jgi:hypothetical protein
MQRARRWRKRELQSIYESVSRHFVAVIVPSNLNRSEELLTREEFICPQADVSAVDFSRGPIPIVCATASFELTFENSIGSSKEMADWEDRNDYLSEAVVFRYDFEPNGLDDEWWVMADDFHQGIAVEGPLPR